MTIHHSISEVEMAILQNHGIVLSAARKLGISRQALDQRIKRHPRLQQAVADGRKDIVQIAEAGLILGLSRGDPWAVQFTLRTLGRELGYGDRIDVHVEIEKVKEQVRTEAEEQGLDPDLAVAEFERILAETKSRR